MPKNPCYIIVDNGTWNAFGRPTYINKYLTQVLTNMGGVSDSVSDGLYVFRMKLGFFKLTYELCPVQS